LQLQKCRRLIKLIKKSIVLSVSKLLDEDPRHNFLLLLFVNNADDDDDGILLPLLSGFDGDDLLFSIQEVTYFLSAISVSGFNASKSISTFCSSSHLNDGSIINTFRIEWLSSLSALLLPLCLSARTETFRGLNTPDSFRETRLLRLFFLFDSDFAFLPLDMLDELDESEIW
ncbi:hypothetical protein DERP_010076, partial [Dermatophagoides pteronyssinus]